MSSEPGSRSSLAPLIIACGGSFVAVIDVTITNLAIPSLARDFGGKVTTLSWVVTLYSIFFAALLAPAGLIADAIGRRRLFAVGVALFTGASLWAALAPSFEQILYARELQGIGAAGLLPASLAFVLADIPPAKRAAAIGLWSASASLAAAVGPSLGGVLVDAFGWRSLFMITVPPGLAMLVGVARLPRTIERRGNLPDIGGCLLLILAIGLLVLGVIKANEWTWADKRTAVCLGGSAVSLGWVIARSRWHPTPALATSLWRIKPYALANAVSLMFGIALYAILLVGVLFLTLVWQYTELKAGLAMTPGAIASAAVAISVGKRKPVPPPRILILVGSMIMVASVVWGYLMLTPEPSFLKVWLPFALINGSGIGLVSLGTSTAAAMSVAPKDFGTATGLNIAARQVGGALGIAMLASLLVRGHGSGDPTTPFVNVYLVAGAASALAAIVGHWLVIPAPAAAPAVNVPAPAYQQR